MLSEKMCVTITVLFGKEQHPRTNRTRFGFVDEMLYKNVTTIFNVLLKKNLKFCKSLTKTQF